MTNFDVTSWRRTVMFVEVGDEGAYRSDVEIKQRSFIVYLLDKSSFSRIYLFTCAAFYSVEGRGKSF